MAAFNDLLSDAFSSKPPNQIRNICLIAHVDHGKTTFADCLVTTNSIISNRMAGKLRYMDSRDDEQLRGITMKSSGVSLLYGPLLVNLIDSPGHVDFSSEVGAAILMSDVALLLVDVIEGVCSQTHSLLRQAVTSGQTVILVINKLDRLKVEVKMTPSEANTLLTRLLEAVNSTLSQIVSCLALEDDTWGDLEALEEKMHFEPSKGNVLFASAIHGYAFGVDEFADIWAPKLKVDRAALSQTIFGDFYFSGGQIKSEAFSKGKKCLFEQLVLDPLWALHDCGLIENDLEKTIALAAKLGILVKSRRLPDAFDEAMRSWLPLPVACFRACARATSALNAFKEVRRLQLVTGGNEAHPLRELISACDSSAPSVAFVAKFVKSDGRQLAIIRVLSGSVQQGLSLYILGKKARLDGSLPLQTTVENVYFMRGRDFVSISTAVAGTICAIQAQGLVQNCTLCSEAATEGLQVGMETGEPLVRVSVSTPNLEKMDELRAALKLLVLLDPSLRVLELDDGELAMVTAGEVHLQKCTKDLHDLGFEELDVSAPIVPFLETVVPDPILNSNEIASQETECRLRDGALYLRLRVVPLSEDVLLLLEKHGEILAQIRKGVCHENEKTLTVFQEKLKATAVETLPSMKGSYWYKMDENEIRDIFDRIWSFGPDKAKGNILFNQIESYSSRNVWNREQPGVRTLDNSMCTGWELFCTAGPLCHESLRGVGVIVNEWIIDETDPAAVGQLVSAVRETCRAAARKHPLRLVAAMYQCNISTATQALGKVHGVLAQRRAKTVSEDINEATGLFEVRALLPVVESFDFCDQLRTRTSGLASGQLEFSHWQVIDEDPYWVPTTQDEIEEFGVKGDSPNHARGYMDAIRRRKGLPTEDLIVASAEKQRTISKKK